ncbi:MAG: SDR family oxidoreductase [Planctomycetes bacterium]|nr:SDR family oxidoreductase [Planctomycetota bacterium]
MMPRAVVTGGTHRVGRAIAVALAERGMTVLVTTRDPARARSFGSIACGDGSITALCADVTTDRGIAAVREAAGPVVRTIVHNASSYESSPIGSIERAAIESSLAVHATAPLLLTQALVPALRRAHDEHGDASVVAMLDIHAMGRPRAGQAVYLTGKAALAGLVDALAIELAPSVRVNGVAPGVVEWDQKADPAERARYEARIPLARAGTPDDAAGAVCWLALDARYTTGTIVRVDGGRALQ